MVLGGDELILTLWRRRLTSEGRLEVVRSKEAIDVWIRRIRLAEKKRKTAEADGIMLICQMRTS